jgi:hypothetical protein
MRRLWRIRDVRILSSNLAVEEALRNLDTSRRRSDLHRLLKTVTVIDQPQTSAAPEVDILPPKDRHILVAAISCGASHLVTGDFTHFFPLFGRRIRGVEVLTFSAYLESRRLRGLDTGERRGGKGRKRT